MIFKNYLGISIFFRNFQKILGTFRKIFGHSEIIMNFLEFLIIPGTIQIQEFRKHWKFWNFLKFQELLGVLEIF
jgi:hypothetical protein